MLGHSKGVDTADTILRSLENDGFEVPLNQLICLGSDGPNVNRTIWNCINNRMLAEGLSGLIPFVPYNPHVIHNAFRKGLNEFGKEVEQFVIDLFHFFKASPCQKEDFNNVQMRLGLDDKVILKHVQCRWLTLIPAVCRVIAQWTALKEYFLSTLPKISRETSTQRELMGSEKYKRICAKLKDHSTLVELCFLQNMKSIFAPIMTLLQREEPLVHVLHEQLSEFIRTLMKRFIKQDVVNEKQGEELLNLDMVNSANELSNLDMEIGEPNITALEGLKESQKNNLFRNMRNFYLVTTKYLMAHLSINNQLLKDLSAVHPLQRKEGQTALQIRRIAKMLPQIIKEEEIGQLSDEWKVYQSQEIPKQWYLEGDTFSRIDEYWQKVMDSRD